MAHELLEKTNKPAREYRGHLKIPGNMEHIFIMYFLLSVQNTCTHKGIQSLVQKIQSLIHSIPLFFILPSILGQHADARIQLESPTWLSLADPGTELTLGHPHTLALPQTFTSHCPALLLRPFHQIPLKVKVSESESVAWRRSCKPDMCVLFYIYAHVAF